MFAILFSLKFLLSVQSQVMFIAKFSSKTIRQEEPIKAQNPLFHFVYECTSLRRMAISPLSLVVFINPTCDADLK